MCPRVGTQSRRPMLKSAGAGRQSLQPVLAPPPPARYKGKVHVIVPFVGRKNGNLIDRQQSYNVLVLRVPGLEEGVMFGGKVSG